MVEIIITDTGEGIPAEVISRIFDPFFTTKEDGVGLGLSLVHKIIENHNGRIRVSSTVGSGTTFTVSLPKADTSETGE
jgi:signal transduction histidine kinase